MDLTIHFNKRHLWMLLITLVATLVPENLSAQQTDYEWSWSTRGGGNRLLSSGTQHIGDLQKVFNIAVDSNNNYYYIVQVGSGTSSDPQPTFGNIPNDTIQIATYNEPNAQRRDTYLVSTTCDGEFRWHKTIGGSGHIYAEGLGTDNEGGVYVAGNVRQVAGSSAIPLHYDLDSIKSTPSLDKKIYLIKYDTLGNFQWLREPQPVSTTPHFASSGEIYVEPDGTVHWMVVLDPNGELENGAVIAQDNYFPITGTQVGDIGIMRYDKNGNFLGYTRLGMDMFGHMSYYWDRQIGFTYDPLYQQYYMIARAWVIYGHTPFHPAIIDGEEVSGVFYLAAFDATTGNSVWWHEHEGMYNNWPKLRDVTVDDTGHVYVVGAMIGGDVVTDYNEFAGYVFDTGISEPFCMKLDNAGQVIWASYPQGAARAGESITVNNDGVFLGQGYATFGGGTHYWHNVPFNRPSGNGADPAVIRLNKDTGEAIAIHDITSPGYGYDDEITAITTDKLGNIVVGGYMKGEWIFDNHPVVPQMDKKGFHFTDFFIAKLGKDGVSCEDEWLNVTETSLPNIKLWPNPTNGELFLEINGFVDNVEVYDIMGRVSISGNSIDKQMSPIMLDLTALKSGIYFVKVFTNDHQQTFKVIKK